MIQKTKDIVGSQPSLFFELRRKKTVVAVVTQLMIEQKVSDGPILRPVRSGIFKIIKTLETGVILFFGLLAVIDLVDLMLVHMCI